MSLYSEMLSRKSDVVGSEGPKRDLGFEGYNNLGFEGLNNLGFGNTSLQGVNWRSAGAVRL